MSPRAGAPSGAPRLTYKASVEALFARDGDVYLMRPGAEPDVVIRAPAPADRALLEALARGPVPACERLQPLLDAGLLTTAASAALDGADAERFARQLPYFAERGDAGATQRRLRAATVAVVGCGGLGTWTLAALASAGVGSVVLVDDDAVELSNLNRQILFGTDDVGRRKVDLAERWLRAFDPAIAVRTEARRLRCAADFAAVVARADLLILAADEPPYDLARWANAACVAAGVPFVTAAQQPPLLRVGPIYAHPGGPCFACHERAMRREHPLYDEVVEQRRRNGVPDTTLGPASGVVGTLLAMELMHLLAGYDTATAGRALLLDMRTLDARTVTVDRDPECPVCS